VNPWVHRSRIGHHQELSVQFYGEDGFLIDELRKFIGSALATGCSAVVIATKVHRENLSRNLKSYGVDVSAATREGRYLAYDAADVPSQFTRNNQIDPARHWNGADEGECGLERTESARRGVRRNGCLALGGRQG
jgi:hypothetical protein